MFILFKATVLSIILCIVIARDTVLSYVPVVMLGYDVVAYHLNVTGCDAMRGKKEYSFQLSSSDANGILRVYSFWFADRNNYHIFKSDPWQYAPRFGGFCSFGECCERLPSWPWNSTFQGPASGPDKANCGFRIHDDGYLYFNILNQYDEMYFANDENIQRGKERWIAWYGSLQSGPFNHHCFSTNGHDTIDDCVEYGQRYAPASNAGKAIYPVDNEYYDDWFDHLVEPTEIGCPEICKPCPDGSCQESDRYCNWLDCSADSYSVFGVIGIGLLLLIVVIVAFICIRKKNTYLTQNFDQLASHDTAANVDTTEQRKKNNEEIQMNEDDTVHAGMLQVIETR